MELAHNGGRAHKVGGQQSTARNAAGAQRGGPAGRTPRLPVWRDSAPTWVVRRSDSGQWRVAAAMEPTPPGVGNVRVRPAGADFLARARGLSALPLDREPFNGDSGLGV